MREDKDKRQKDMAEYLGCCQQTYSKYENGKAQPSLQIMMKLANYFNTSVDYLIGLTDEPNPYPRGRKK